MKNKIVFNPNSKLEKFGLKVYEMIVENFPETYFVGGMVRDLLLKRDVVDIDIATAAIPGEILNIFKPTGFSVDLKSKKFGVTIISKEKLTTEITTFREDSYKDSRFPKVKFIKSAKIDSFRRDFTINTLYLKPKSGEIFDFQNGIIDLKKGLVRTVREPNRTFRNDPLRIIRALRFVDSLGFSLEEKTNEALNKKYFLLQRLSKERIENEIRKIRNIALRNKIFTDTKKS